MGLSSLMEKIMRSQLLIKSIQIKAFQLIVDEVREISYHFAGLKT